MMQRHVFFEFSLRVTSVLICLITCGAIGTVAQSGRQRPVPNPLKTPVTIIEPVTAAPTTTPKISSLIVVGEIIHDYSYFKSTLLDSTLKEFVHAMKLEPRPFMSVERAGKHTYDRAKERAKRETDTHLVWLGIVTHDNGLGVMYVDYLDFAVLVPRTGDVLFNGRIEPGQQRIVGQGGVLKIPRVTNKTTANLQMLQGAREVTYRLKSTGWLCTNAPC